MAAKRQAARYLVHDRNDLLHDITAVTAGGAFGGRLTCRVTQGQRGFYCEKAGRRRY